MSDDEIPDIVQKTLEEDGVEDVSDQYSEVIEMFVELAEARGNPVPFQHVLAYTAPEFAPSIIILQFVIDTDDENLDKTFAFEITVDKETARSMECGDDDASLSDTTMQSFNRSLRSAEEAIWGTVLNDPFER